MITIGKWSLSKQHRECLHLYTKHCCHQYKLHGIPQDKNQELLPHLNKVNLFPYMHEYEKKNLLNVILTFL